MIVIPQIIVRSERIARGSVEPPVEVVQLLTKLGAEQVGILDLDGRLGLETVPSWLQCTMDAAGVPVRIDVRLDDAQGVDRLARTTAHSVVLSAQTANNPLLLRWSIDLLGDRLILEAQIDGPYIFDPPAAQFGRELHDVLQDVYVHGVRRVLIRDVTGESIPQSLLLELGNRLPGIRLSYQGPVRDIGAIRDLARVGPVMEAVILDAALVVEHQLDLSVARKAALLA